MAKKTKASGPVVGLDIGSRWIKAVELRPGKGGAVVTGIGYEPTPQGAIVEEAILDPSAVAEAVKRLFANSGISAKKVVSSVSGQSAVVVRVIEVPKMTPQELAETMKWEVERHIPFPSSEIVMDFKTLERPSAVPGAQNMEVLLAVCQEDVIRKHLDTLTSAKLTPAAIEVEPVAVPRSLINGHPDIEAHGTVAVADIGSESTKFGIYEQKLLVFPRTVPIATINLIRAVEQALGVEEGEAERLLREQALVDMDLVAQAGGAAAAEVEPAETHYDLGPTYSTPFSDPHRVDSGASESGPAPPVSGFDLGDDEFVEASPIFGEQPAQDDTGLSDSPFAPAGGFDLGEEPSGSTGSSGGAFDLGDNPDSPSSSEPTGDVFDLGDTDMRSSGPVFDLDDAFAGSPTPDLPSEADASAAPPPTSLEPSPHSDSTQSQIAQAIAPVVVELATEISRSLDYYNARNPQPADVLVICGGAAKIPGLAAYLESALGLPVQVGDPVGNLALEAKRTTPEALAEIAPVFSTSVGLALRDYVGEG
ncbi:MAG: type IV pilus assembly protein PilM [Armatimonadetes bacterium]|nr:type IV pilus assembly protein PilM [Armatimonadota bacterium]